MVSGLALLVNPKGSHVGSSISEPINPSPPGPSFITGPDVLATLATFKGVKGRNADTEVNDTIRRALDIMLDWRWIECWMNC
mmetsp:Transcript_16988/g.25116  ORF Transcript_16988/g.25116 Transcript_16988/m.25116 type:complete len:82 (-) Transcript_16988:28-273(-)